MVKGSGGRAPSAAGTSQASAAQHPHTESQTTTAHTAKPSSLKPTQHSTVLVLVIAALSAACLVLGACVYVQLSTQGQQLSSILALVQHTKSTCSSPPTFSGQQHVSRPTTEYVNGLMFGSRSQPVTYDVTEDEVDNIIVTSNSDPRFPFATGLYWELLRSEKHRPLLFSRPHARHVFRDLLTVDDVLHIISTKRLPYETDVKLVAAGKTAFTSSTKPALLDDVLAAMGNRGATLVINDLIKHHERIRQFCLELERLDGGFISANMYLSPPGAQGFSLHYDQHSVIVLQIAGSKTWDVFEPTKAFESKPWSDRTFVEEDLKKRGRHWTFKLAEGDVLVLPRGYIHRARTGDAHSMHVTLTNNDNRFAWSEVILNGVKALTARRSISPSDAKRLKDLVEAASDDDSIVALRIGFPTNTLDFRGDFSSAAVRKQVYNEFQDVLAILQQYEADHFKGQPLAASVWSALASDDGFVDATNLIREMRCGGHLPLNLDISSLQPQSRVNASDSSWLIVRRPLAEVCILKNVISSGEPLPLAFIINHRRSMAAGPEEEYLVRHLQNLPTEDELGDRDAARRAAVTMLPVPEDQRPRLIDMAVSSGAFRLLRKD